jgi:hypothetical protein
MSFVSVTNPAGCQFSSLSFRLENNELSSPVATYLFRYVLMVRMHI